MILYDLMNSKSACGVTQKDVQLEAIHVQLELVICNQGVIIRDKQMNNTEYIYPLTVLQSGFKIICTIDVIISVESKPLPP